MGVKTVGSFKRETQPLPPSSGPVVPVVEVPTTVVQNVVSGDDYIVVEVEGPGKKIKLSALALLFLGALPSTPIPRVVQPDGSDQTGALQAAIDVASAEWEQDPAPMEQRRLRPIHVGEGTLFISAAPQVKSGVSLRADARLTKLKGMVTWVPDVAQADDPTNAMLKCISTVGSQLATVSTTNYGDLRTAVLSSSIAPGTWVLFRSDSTHTDIYTTGTGVFREELVRVVSVAGSSPNFIHTFDRKLVQVHGAGTPVLQVTNPCLYCEVIGFDFVMEDRTFAVGLLISTASNVTADVAGAGASRAVVQVRRGSQQARIKAFQRGQNNALVHIESSHRCDTVTDFDSASCTLLGRAHINGVPRGLYSERHRSYYNRLRGRLGGGCTGVSLWGPLTGDYDVVVEDCLLTERIGRDPDLVGLLSGPPVTHGGAAGLELMAVQPGTAQTEVSVACRIRAKLIDCRVPDENGNQGAFFGEDIRQHHLEHLEIVNTAGSVSRAENIAAMQVTQIDDPSGTPAYLDLTAAFNSSTAGDAPVYPTVEVVGDRLAIGSKERFTKLVLTLGTLGVGGTTTPKYWNGSTYVALPGVTDTTANLTASGFMTWKLPPDWKRQSINGSPPLYYIFLEVATTYSTNPVITQGFIASQEFFVGAVLFDSDDLTFDVFKTKGVQYPISIYGGWSRMHFGFVDFDAVNAQDSATIFMSWGLYGKGQLPDPGASVTIDSLRAREHPTFFVIDKLDGAQSPIDGAGRAALHIHQMLESGTGRMWRDIRRVYDASGLANWQLKRGDTMEVRAPIAAVLDHTTDTFTFSGHAWINGIAVFIGYTGAGAFPGNYTAGTIMYVVNSNVGAGTFQLSLSPGGAVHNFSGNGTNITVQSIIPSVVVPTNTKNSTKCNILDGIGWGFGTPLPARYYMAAFGSLREVRAPAAKPTLQGDLLVAAAASRDLDIDNSATTPLCIAMTAKPTATEGTVQARFV